MQRQILRESEIYPNWHLVLNNICVKVGFNNEDLVLNFSLREIMMTDYYRNEASQAMVGYASNKMVKTQGVETDDMSAYD